MNHLPLKSLRFFLSAAQHHSFKAAAEELFVSQAAVSQQIRLLEENLQCQLFERRNKKTELSLEGKRLLPYIESAFSQINLGLKTLQNDPNPNVLRVTSLHSFTSLFLIPKIADFQSQFPDVLVQFSPSNQLTTFKNQEIDIALRKGLGDYANVETRKIADDHLVLVGSPILLKDLPQTPEHIFQLPFLEDTSDDVQESILDCLQRFNINRRTIKPFIQVDDSVPIIENTLAGRGIALVSHFLVADYLRKEQLVNILNYSYPTPYSLYLVAPEQHFSWNKVKIFEEWLKGEVQTAF